MSGRTFIVKYFSKKMNWHSNKLPDYGHVNYTRTLLSKHFQNCAVQHCKNKDKWGKTGALMEGEDREERRKERRLFGAPGMSLHAAV